MRECVHACNNKLNVEKRGETSIGGLLMSFNEVTLNLKLAEELTFQQDWILAKPRTRHNKEKKKELVKNWGIFSSK